MNKSTTSQPNPPTAMVVAPVDTDIVVMAGWMNEIRTSFSEIAVLTERYTQVERRLADTEERTADVLDEIKQQVVRVHDRLDAMQVAVREEVSGVRSEFRNFSDVHRGETTAQIAKAISPVWEKVDSNTKLIQDTKAELSSWINRGKGAWFVGAIFAGVFQACIVGALIWLLSEVKTTHDWRIIMEAQRPHERRNESGAQ